MTSPSFIRRLSIGASALLGISLVAGAIAPAASADNPPSKIVSGWIPYWMSSQKIPTGINNAVANADLFTDVSPFWYSATKTSGGNVTVGFNKNYGSSAANSSWAVAQLRAAGIPVIPSIADASGAKTMAKVLADPAKRTAHVNDIVNIVMSNNYDGIDLDYEAFAFSDGSSSWNATKPNWTAFVQELGNALHAQGKKLVVTIPPACSMGGSCGVNTGYHVYNMEVIAPSVDLIRIMAYDYSVSGAGPIAPYNWVRSIVAHAASITDPQKIQIGVPTYARYWTQKKSGGAPKLTGTCPSSSSSGAQKAAYNSLTSRGSMTEVDIPAFIASQGGEPQWDDEKKEYFFEYQKVVNWNDSSGASQTCTASRIMWFLGDNGVLTRTQLVGEFGINAAAYWTIGGENSSQWPLIRAYAQSLAPAVPEVAVAAPPTVVFGQPSSVTTSGQFNGAPIIGANAILQQKSGESWIDIVGGLTGEDGAVGLPIALTSGGTFRIVMGATASSPEVVSAEFAISIAPAITAKAKTKKVKAGKTLKVSLIARPGIAGQKVTLQVQRGAKWKNVAKAKTKANGRVVIKDKAPKKKGKYVYRVLTAQTDGVLAGVSNPVTIKVK
ncbi:MAG: glycosyl hydrolase family 18 protein [Candidatus Nanopelagicales bacterium]